MLKSLKGLTITLFAVTAFSCVSNEKINYLQNLEWNEPIPEGELIQYEIPEYRLQYNDIIDVNAQSIYDLIEGGFNNKNISGNNQQMQVAGQSGGDIYYMTGYTVDEKGNIRLPEEEG